MSGTAEVSFPRGGVQPSTPSGDDAKAKKRDAADFLFGSAADKSTSKSPQEAGKRRKKGSDAAASSSGAKSLLPYGGGAVVHPAKGEGWIESLGFSKLHPGFSLLAVVREIHDELVVFSLPNQWTGFMLNSNKGDGAVSCTAMFQVGEMLAVRIVKAVQETTKTGPRRRIQVTALPAKVNAPSTRPAANRLVRGQILSIEDHGFLVDLGWQRKGFLAFAGIQGPYEVAEEDDDASKPVAVDTCRRLGKGRILDVLVKKSEGNMVALELPSLAEAKKKLLLSNNLPPLDDLQPGTLVHCVVEKPVKNGLCVTFGSGAYRGAIDLQHLGGSWIPDHREESKEWRSIFEKVRSFKARIIAVDAASKIVRLSLLQHILHMKLPPSMPAVGTVHEGTVIRLDEGVGALLSIPDLLPEMEGVDKAFASELYKNEAYLEATRMQSVYVHISKAMTTTAKERTTGGVFAKEFAPSTQHPVRILNTSNLMEGVASGASAPGVVNAQVLSYTDIEAGKLYKQVPICAHLDSSAILVDFGMGIVGQVPAIHLFDKQTTSEFRTRMRKVKYAIKAKVDVRVLSVDAAAKKCVATAKKSLVTETNVITDFADVRVGIRTTGFVSKIDRAGLSVTFFNGVFGRVTKRSLRNEMGLEKATDQYAVGDVVTCQVIQIKKRGQLQTSDDMEVDAPDTPQRPYYEITLTLREGAQPSKEAQDGNEVDAQIRTGSVLPVKALRVLELVNGKGKGGNSFVPGFAIVEVKSKHILQDSVVGETVECKLPFDQIFDEYNEEWLRSAAALDKQAATVLTVGEKINQKSLVLTDPKKTSTEYKSGTGRLAMISLRPRLVELAAGEKPSDAIPSPETQLYVGAEVVGFVCQIDRRYGAFVRFLDGLTGLVPKVKGGLSLPLYGTVKSKVIAIDVSRKPPKILLDKATPFQATSHVTSEESSEPSFSVGDSIAEAEVVKVDLCRAMLKDLKTKSTCQLRLHCTMVPYRKKKATSSRPHSGDSLPPSHPFFGWNVGMKLSDLEVVSVERRGKSELVDVLMASTVDKDDDKKSTAPTFLKSASSLSKGQPVSGVVASVAKDGSGVWLLVSPTVSGFLPALEISDDTEILNNLGEKFPRGSRLDCFVRAFPTGKQDLQQDRVELTMMKSERKAFMQGDMVVGRVNKKIAEREAPAIMVDLPGGLRGRCCITEVADTDKWKNLPLAMNEVDNQPGKGRLSFGHGEYLAFAVLEPSETNHLVQLSLRKSRTNGSFEEDTVPSVGEVTQAYVISTNKKGCFLRVSRSVTARCILKELSDGFLPDPAASFPPGRLVVGRVKAVREENARPVDGFDKRFFVDLNLKESSVSDAKKAIELKDIEVGEKYQGTVSRIEDYGVFVLIEGSSLYGLVHKSECSDRFIKDVSTMYSPGDLVKVIVLKKDEEKRQIGFSMKASHFEEDAEEDGAGMNSDSEQSDDGEEESVDSEAEGNDVKMQEQDESDEDNDSGSDSDEEDSDDEIGGTGPSADAMDMDVDFEWKSGKEKPASSTNKDDSSSSDSSDSDEDEDESNEKGNKSRKNRGSRRREEKEISEREKSLADGTADANPETAGDYERLVTSNPNSSELWIRYMAFYLTLADLDAARKTAERALERIEFREEREKLNVWCALLTLEIKYGTEDTVNDTIRKACSQSNPKHVHLRVCEIMEKEVKEGGEMTRQRVDDMFTLACKKFKSKKKVWNAHGAYLLRTGRYEEALSLSKRALLSLPSYKHTEMMSKMAQLMFEHDRVEQARTIFDSLLAKNSKRLDLFSVYCDKEVKHGNVEAARMLFQDVAGVRNSSRAMKLTEKQMKKLFKQWYQFEERNGSKDNCDAVKQAAVAYVEGK